MNLAQIFFGPLAGALGGWLGALLFRSVLSRPTIGIGIGVLASVIVVNLGVAIAPWFATPGFEFIGPSVIDPFVFGTLASAVAGAGLWLLKRAQGVGAEEADRGPLAAAPAATGPRASSGTGKVFLSYRRADSIDVTGRIYDRLCQQLGRDRICRDVDSIPPGVDFRTHIEALLNQCDTCLVVIGPQWLTVKDAKGRLRLTDPADHVRLEVESVLARKMKIIPVLVGGTEMPQPQSLPASLELLSYINALRVRPDPDFHRDMDRLLAELGAAPVHAH